MSVEDAAPQMLAALKLFKEHAKDKEATNRWNWLNKCYWAAEEAIARAEGRPVDDPDPIDWEDVP